MGTFLLAGYEGRSGDEALFAPVAVRCLGERGFTLVEMVVVIIVMTVLAFSIGIPSLSNPSVNQRALARQLANDIRLAQSYALSLGSGATASGGASTYQVCTPTAVCSTMTLGNGTVSAFNLTFNGYGATTDATITVTLGGISSNVVVTGATGVVVVQ